MLMMIPICAKRSSPKTMATSAHTTALYSTKTTCFNWPFKKRVVQPEVMTDFDRKYSLMPDKERYALVKDLQKLNRKDWSLLSLADKKALAYGVPLEIDPYFGRKVFVGVAIGIGAAASMLYITVSNRRKPKTMEPEYQEAMKVRMKELNINPIFGISSEENQDNTTPSNVNLD